MLQEIVPLLLATAITGAIGLALKKLIEKFLLARGESSGEIEHYLASGEWRGKAGGYAIQGLAASFIPAITGSYSNVVGLPLADTWALLRGLGYRP